MSTVDLQVLTSLRDNAYLSTDKFHCCQALFFKCRGSALALSINLPTSGGNSCLDFFWAMKEVSFSRLVLGFNFEVDICSFFFVTASATLIRSLYFQGFHLLSGVRPKEPWTSLISLLLISAKGQKYVAEMVSSPPRKA